MRFPLSLTTDMAGYMIRKKLWREKRFPLVMMLEPLHACNRDREIADVARVALNHLMVDHLQDQ